MARIRYNGVDNLSGIISFTDIPNILKVEDTSGGTKAFLLLNFAGNLKAATTADTQWTISFLGETISSVLDPKNAVNKNFYCGTTPQSTAASVAKALRNCSTIAANFTIEHSNYQVMIRARAVGQVWTGMNGWYETNIPSTFLTNSATDGTADSPLVGAEVSVDVFTGNHDYVTTLSKNWYGGECAFNMSPVLTTIAELGQLVPYTFSVSYTKNGEYTSLASIPTNYVAVGFMCNQGLKYIPFNSNHILAQNVSRGNPRDITNNTILYTYQPSVTFSVFGNTGDTTTLQVKYLDSAFNQISAYTVDNWRQPTMLYDVTVNLNWQPEAFSKAFYVDIALGTYFTLRYNVIKPVKAAEDALRIYWRNSYGGVSHFDFTGQKTETRELETMTYQKNIFDYYEANKNELERVYDNDVNYSVTVKSHLFEHDGKYIFNDLIQSPYAWVERNGEQYAIIIDSVSVEEQDRNDVYVATAKFHYSQPTSLL